MTIRDIVGTVSAGTLGYITGNMKGARRAVALYQNYSNMPKSQTNRGRSTSRGRVTKRRRVTSTSTVRGGRDVSMSRASSRRRSVSVARSVSAARSANSDGNNVVAPISKKKGNKVARKGIKKKLKVPNELRKQIKAVVNTTNKAIGRYTDIKYYKITPSDSQVVQMMGVATQGGFYNLFDPAYILYVASTLFNGAPVQNAPTTASPQLFSPRTLTVEVLKQSVTYRMKNNTQRTLTVKVWDISPKSRQFANGFDPYAYWQTTFSTEAANSPHNPNKYSITPETLYANPKMSEAWRQMFQMDEVIFELEPGKEAYHKVVGPNMLYDFQKFWDSASFSNQQKFIKHTMICVYTDIINTTLGSVGRFTDIVSAEPYDLLIEQTMFTKIAVPEQAGFTWPAVTPTTGVAALDKRYSVYALQNWAGAQSGLVQGVSDENPQAPITGSGE